VQDWHGWIIAALLLFIAEMFVPGFWLACVAIGSLLAGIVALLPIGLPLQVVTFAVTTLASFIGIRPFLIRHFQLGQDSGLRTNVDALLGKTGRVTERIDPDSHRGRVIVDGEDWRGASLDNVVLEPGTRITVIQVDGTTLVVEKDG